MSEIEARALVILQELLDRISPCVMDGRVDELTQYFCLPYRRRFINREVVIETEADMQRDTVDFGRSLQAIGATQCICLANRAEYISDDYISGRYTTHVLRDAQAIVPSYESQVVMRRQAQGNWTMQELQHNVYVTGFPVDLVHVPAVPPLLPDPPPDDDRRSAADARAIYQAYLDRTAETVAAGRFEDYAALMDFPYTAHGSEMNQVISDKDGLRPFYEVLRRCHSGEVGDRIERVAERAEFIGAGLICGYHTGTVYLDGVQTVAAVRSRMILARRGADWRLKSVANSISNMQYPFDMYQPGGDLRTQLQIEKPDKGET